MNANISLETFAENWHRIQMNAYMSLKTFAQTLQKVADTEYRSHHGKLPGSTRTKRLRKKRRAKTNAWYAKKLNQFQ